MELVKIDRRVARTREALFNALVKLIHRKDYDAISVQDILEEADVGRSTFYAHFTSKDDLLERSLQRLRTILIKAHRELPSARMGEPLAFSRTVLEHVGENKNIYDALTGRHAGAIVLKAIREIFADFVREDLGTKRNDAIPRELAVQHVAGAFMTTMIWWLERKPSLAPEKVDAMFRHLALKGIERRFAG